MLKFKTRSAARTFASKSNKKVVDLSSEVVGSRWCVKVVS